MHPLFYSVKTNEPLDIFSRNVLWAEPTSNILAKITNLWCLLLQNHKKETLPIQAPWGPADWKAATAKHQGSTLQDTRPALVNRLAKTSCHTVTIEASVAVWWKISLDFVDHVLFENSVAAAACERQTIVDSENLFFDSVENMPGVLLFFKFWTLTCHRLLRLCWLRQPNLRTGFDGKVVRWWCTNQGLQ